MTRRLFAVALLPHGALAAAVDALRAGLADPRLADLPSHLTLVPPIPLSGDGAAALPAALRRVAAASEPFDLHLGPAATFAPRTATLHLAVGGELDRLGQLRDALRTDPLDRAEEHDFVPHVTLLQRATTEQIDAGLTLLRAPLGEWPVGSIHLLERLRLGPMSLWHPVAEEPLGGPRVVGRGGVELHLRSISVVEPAVAALAEDRWPPPLPAGAPTLVTVAELPGRAGTAVGAAWGRADASGAVLDGVVVERAERGKGIARRVVDDWCLAAARRGAGVVVARRPTGTVRAASDLGDDSMAAALGFSAADLTTWWRRLGALGELGSAP